MPRQVRISLANKCQLLFGLAVVLILTAALAVGAVRMQTLVREGQMEAARHLADAWLEGMIQLDDVPSSPGSTADLAEPPLMMTLVKESQLEPPQAMDVFLAEAVEAFRANPNREELFRLVEDHQGRQFYRYARAVRESHGSGTDAAGAHGRDAQDQATGITDPLRSILHVQVGAQWAEQQLMINRVYLLAAGLLAGLLAIGAFWFITMRIILSPVRVLRDTAAKVSAGDINIRSDINTGDEYEQLSDAFNTMLENLKTNQDELRSVNKSLDLKIGELAATNVGLYEANKMKGEFLANVSHELRTPLNSIIGFAEVLGETFDGSQGLIDEKRARYVNNIIISSRRLLDLINDLLDLAKIEAGRMDLRVSPLSVVDTVEGLVNLMRPQATKNQIQLKLEVQRDLPVVHTDAGKFQQILFNLLSNAIKFTPAQGTVTLSASGLPSSASQPAPEAARAVQGGNGHKPRVCVSVRDTGPGIPFDRQETIFEKFTQLDSTVTREHSGTGLGLAISRDLAKLLHGEIVLDSEEGRGATFSLIIPQVLETDNMPLMPDTDDTVVDQDDPSAP